MPIKTIVMFVQLAINVTVPLEVGVRKLVDELLKFVDLPLNTITLGSWISGVRNATSSSNVPEHIPPPTRPTTDPLLPTCGAWPWSFHPIAYRYRRGQQSLAESSGTKHIPPRRTCLGLHGAELDDDRPSEPVARVDHPSTTPNSSYHEEHLHEAPFLQSILQFSAISN